MRRPVLGDQKVRILVAGEIVKCVRVFPNRGEIGMEKAGPSSMPETRLISGSLMPTTASRPGSFAANVLKSRSYETLNTTVDPPSREPPSRAPPTRHVDPASSLSARIECPETPVPYTVSAMYPGHHGSLPSLAQSSVIEAAAASQQNSSASGHFFTEK
jgi:hypothetical protein